MNLLGYFESPEERPAVRFHVVFDYGFATADDSGAYDLAEDRVGHRKRCAIFDVRHPADCVLDFPSKDVLAADVDHVLASADNMKKAGLIQISHVSGQKETVIGEIVIVDGHKITAERVAIENRVALDGDLADLAR